MYRLCLVLFFSASLSNWHYLFWWCIAILILNLDLWLIFVYFGHKSMCTCLPVFQCLCLCIYVYGCLWYVYCERALQKLLIQVGSQKWSKNGKYFIFSSMYACRRARARKTMYQFEFRSRYALHERKPAKYEIIWARAYNDDAVLNVVYVCSNFEIGLGPNLILHLKRRKTITKSKVDSYNSRMMIYKLNSLKWN